MLLFIFLLFCHLQKMTKFPAVILLKLMPNNTVEGKTPFLSVSRLSLNKILQFSNCLQSSYLLLEDFRW